MYHLGLQDGTEKGYVKVPFAIHQCCVLCCAFLTIFYVPRAAEDLLSQIQENYQKPQEELAVLKEAVSSLLSTHNSDVQAAEELLREAEMKTQEAVACCSSSGPTCEFNVSPASSRPLELVPDSPVVTSSLLLKKMSLRADFSTQCQAPEGSEADLLL